MGGCELVNEGGRCSKDGRFADEGLRNGLFVAGSESFWRRAISTRRAAGGSRPEKTWTGMCRVWVVG